MARKRSGTGKANDRCRVESVFIKNVDMLFFRTSMQAELLVLRLLATLTKFGDTILFHILHVTGNTRPSMTTLVFILQEPLETFYSTTT